MTRAEAESLTIRPSAFAAKAQFFCDESAAGQPSRMSFSLGLPPAFEVPPADGGVLISRSEINSIGRLGTRSRFFEMCGGYYTFDAAFCDSIGGYAKGAVLEYYIPAQNAMRRVVSLIDNNKVDFTTRGVDGVSWDFCDAPSPYFGFMLNGTSEDLTNAFFGYDGQAQAPIDGSYDVTLSKGVAPVLTVPQTGVLNITAAVQFGYANEERANVINRDVMTNAVIKHTAAENERVTTHPVGFLAASWTFKKCTNSVGKLFISAAYDATPVRHFNCVLPVRAGDTLQLQYTNAQTITKSQFVGNGNAWNPKDGTDIYAHVRQKYGNVADANLWKYYYTCNATLYNGE